MTLLITVFAAIIATVVWYMNSNRSELRLGTLVLMFWGASIMWFVDAIFEYAADGAGFFVPESADMINDAYLGFSVVALGCIIWLITLLLKDPKGVIKKAVSEQR